MKNRMLRQILVISLCLFTSDFFLKAQAPQGIPFQAIARNSTGQAIANTPVRARFSIRDSIATGPVRYQETHNPTTSALGLFSVNVGMGTVVSGTFSGINWGKNAKFLQVELDPAGGTTYTDLGTTQMMSVPYALNAASANSATNWTPSGTGYGEVKLFNCDGLFQYTPCLPKITTNVTSAITTTTATSGGNISTNGGGSITASGICWSTSQNPTIALSTKSNEAAGAGSFVSSITGLIPNTLYYVRAYATNAAGTAYGSQVSFTSTAVVLPTISTTAASAITTTSATSGGNISSDGGSNITARGICWSTSQNPTIALTSKTSNGTGNGSFVSSITGLNPNTLYYVRAYATNSAGTAYGSQVSFNSTAVVLATISTTAASAITTTSATSGGNISSDGGANITARGICWSTSQNPTIALTTKTSNGIGTGSFASNLTGLIPNTLYYVRAYATNSSGTAYGSQISLTPAAAVDADGNFYSAVNIGNQLWMKENLNVTKYRNGIAIPTGLSDVEWSSTTSGAYSIVNSVSDISTYGLYYNWYATADPRGLCPNGWHVPTEHDWQLLIKYLDPAADTTNWTGNAAGGKMKSTGTVNAGTGLWSDPNTEATNSSGFTGFPYGSRRSPMNGNWGAWWSSTQDSTAGDCCAFWRTLNYASGSFDRNAPWKQVPKTDGYSVRCLRD